MVINKTKSHRVFIRVNDNEKEIIESEAEKKNMTVSAYIRFLVFSAREKKHIEIDMLPLRTATYELRKQGNNLNQLMYFLNSHSSNCTKNDIENVRYTLQKEGKALEKLMEALMRVNTMSKQHKISLINDDVDLTEYDVLTGQKFSEQSKAKK